MSNLALQNLARRRARVRSKISGTAIRPRLSVKITLRHVTAQLIDDATGRTIAAVTTVGAKDAKGTMTERAIWAGNKIAGLAKTKKVTTVVFDRGSRIYHGRLHALADAARKEGLEF